MSAAAGASLLTAARSDVGLVRAANEDFLADFEHPSGRRLLVVADGMGGHRGGATASRLCVESLGEVFRHSTEEPEPLLRDALESANERIHQTACNDRELRGMGTTAVALLLTPDSTAWVAHLGDSRAYLLRSGVLRPLTEDHTVVAALVKRGVLTFEAAAAHPRRNELVRCVGFHDEVQPEITHLDVLPGDRFLLCSDGLSNLVDESEIAAILQREALADAVGALVEAANARGGSDNITVMLAAVPGGATTVVDSTAPRIPAGSGAGAAGSATDCASDCASDSESGSERNQHGQSATHLAARRGEIVRQHERQLEEHRRRRRAAVVTTIVAGALALSMLWMTFR